MSFLSHTTASQSPLLSTTGSLTGYRSQILNLGNGYLTAGKQRNHALCGNKEGWGPLSPYRYDFTPCFMDVWVATIAAYGILFGAVAIWWLVKRKNKAAVERDWHFWSKQVCSFG